jgi:cobalamin biosynthesis protein CobT
VDIQYKNKNKKDKSLMSFNAQRFPIACSEKDFAEHEPEREQALEHDESTNGRKIVRHPRHQPQQKPPYRSLHSTPAEPAIGKNIKVGFDAATAKLLLRLAVALERIGAQNEGQDEDEDEDEDDGEEAEGEEAEGDEEEGDEEEGDEDEDDDDVGEEKPHIQSRKQAASNISRPSSQPKSKYKPSVAQPKPKISPVRKRTNAKANLKVTAPKHHRSRV